MKKKKKKWKPSASISNLKKRSKIISNIRLFFSKRNIMEVETPILSHSTITDMHLTPFYTHYLSVNDKKKFKLWLITSPEYHMKRLLAAESGPIYQICHSFRNKEFGQYHNPEFTMLEWYRPSYSMKKLMSEVDEFLQIILKCKSADQISYQKVFIQYLNIDPFHTNISELCHLSKKLELHNLIYLEKDLNKIVEILFSLKIEPYLGKNKPLLVYHFPASQSSLAALNKKDSCLSERFEIFFKGIELGNGFYELTDHNEQKNRFIEDNRKRFCNHLPQHDIDQLFLKALSHGLPPSSGIAIGLDRLIMLALKQKHISQVMAFSLDHC